MAMIIIIVIEGFLELGMAVSSWKSRMFRVQTLV